MKINIFKTAIILSLIIFLSGCVKDNPSDPVPPPPPSGQSLFLNEFLATSATAQPDWIEIVNIGSDTINLSGYVLSDSSRTGAWQPFTIGNIKIPPNGFRQFVNGTDFTFGLGSSNEGIRLYDPNWVVIDSYYWTATQIADRTTGRIPDGTGAWTPNLTPTPGAPNQP